MLLWPQPGNTAARSIGYRQTLEYLLAKTDDVAKGDVANDDMANGDMEGADVARGEAFRDFLGRFCTVSRQYATEQMKWFRRDAEYLWVRPFLPVLSN
eukprot:COSAG05_NODE_3546_length_1998_cov_27.151132_3_plen_98_part_00